MRIKDRVLPLLLRLLLLIIIIIMTTTTTTTAIGIRNLFPFMWLYPVIKRLPPSFQKNRNHLNLNGRLRQK